MFEKGSILFNADFASVPPDERTFSGDDDVEYVPGLVPLDCGLVPGTLLVTVNHDRKILRGLIRFFLIHQRLLDEIIHFFHPPKSEIPYLF